MMDPHLLECGLNTTDWIAFPLLFFSALYNGGKLHDPERLPVSSDRLSLDYQTHRKLWMPQLQVAWFSRGARHPTPQHQCTISPHQQERVIDSVEETIINLFRKLFLLFAL